MCAKFASSFTVQEIIHEVADSVPRFRKNKTKVRRRAIITADRYLALIDDSHALFPQDIAMAALFWACHDLGPRMSFYELAKEAKTDLIAWPTVAEDMRLHANSKNRSR